VDMFVTLFLELHAQYCPNLVQYLKFVRPSSFAPTCLLNLFGSRYYCSFPNQSCPRYARCLVFL